MLVPVSLVFPFNFKALKVTASCLSPPAVLYFYGDSSGTTSMLHNGLIISQIQWVPHCEHAACK